MCLRPWHVRAITALEMGSEILQVFLPTRSVCPDHVDGNSAYFELESGVVAVRDELKRDGVLGTFFFPHSHDKMPLGDTDVNPALAVESAGVDDDSEYAANVKIATNVPEPAGQALWFGHRRPDIPVHRFVPNLHPDYPESIK